nr:MAG TPA: hypothetical protein [Caudoviricetes sp.]
MFLFAHRTKCFLLPYRYFNKSLVLYSSFLDSRQTDLARFSVYSSWSLTPQTSMDSSYLSSKRLFFASHKDSAIDLFMMIRHTELLIVPIFTVRITSGRGNH